MKGVLAVTMGLVGALGPNEAAVAPFPDADARNVSIEAANETVASILARLASRTGKRFEFSPLAGDIAHIERRSVRLTNVTPASAVDAIMHTGSPLGLSYTVDHGTYRFKGKRVTFHGEFPSAQEALRRLLDSADLDYAITVEERNISPIKVAANNEPIEKVFNSFQAVGTRSNSFELRCRDGILVPCRVVTRTKDRKYPDVCLRVRGQRVEAVLRAFFEAIESDYVMHKPVGDCFLTLNITGSSRKVLEEILRMAGLTYRIQEGVYWVRPARQPDY